MFQHNASTKAPHAVNGRPSSSRTGLRSGALVLLALLWSGVVSAANQIGRLTSVGTNAARTFYAYDDLGRTVRESYVFDGNRRDVTMRFAYPHAPSMQGPGSHMVERKYPDGEVLTYGYDRAGGVTSLRTPAAPIVTSVSRNARGELTRIAFGNGVVSTRTYNETTDLRLRESVSSKAPSNPIQHYVYEFDPNGNVTSIEDRVAPSLSAEYEYDTLDQLTTLRNGAHSVVETYNYDAAGNLTQKGGRTQTYGGPGRGPRAIATAGEFEYLYDANGNVTEVRQFGMTVHRLAWDAENMAVHQEVRVGAFTTTIDKSFVGEELWKKVEGTATTYYLPSVRVEDRGLRKFFDGYAERSPEDGRLRFYHPDHLGSSTVVTDDSGQPIRRIGYMPWGEDKEGDPTLTFRPKYQFNFKEREESSGLYDYGARLYNPLTGRWLSPDDDDTDGPNRYTYVGNNPTSRIDPDGHQQRSGSGFTCRAQSSVSCHGNPNYDVNIHIRTGPIDSETTVKFFQYGSYLPGPPGVVCRVITGCVAVMDAYFDPTPENIFDAGMSFLRVKTKKSFTWTPQQKPQIQASSLIPDRRPSWRKTSLRTVWDKATKGKKKSSKQCSTCGRDVFGNPHNKGERRDGPQGWDADHITHWDALKKALKAKRAKWKAYRDAFNDPNNLRVRCQHCNRSDNK